MAASYPPEKRRDYIMPLHESDGAEAREGGGRAELRRPFGGRSPARVPHDGAIAQDRRQGDSAQGPEPDLLSDQRRRARGGPHRRRPAAEAGPRLVPSLLSRPRAVSRARHDAARDAAQRRRRQGRSEFWRAPDALALGAQAAE